MPILIRKALEADMDTLLTFEKGISDTERPFDETLKEGEIHYYDLRALIRSENAEVLVAVADEGIIGSGYARILSGESYQKFAEYAYVGFMYVVPSFRGQGISNMILEELKDWARGRNLTEMRLEVYEGNTPAIRAYAKAGFKPNLLKMRIALAAENGPKFC